MRDLCKQSPAVLTAAGARYRCLAVNNNLTEAAETELRINMLCECPAWSWVCCINFYPNFLVPPLAVKISSDTGPFAAGHDYYVR